MLSSGQENRGQPMLMIWLNMERLPLYLGLGNQSHADNQKVDLINQNPTLRKEVACPFFTSIKFQELTTFYFFWLDIR